MIKKVDSRLTDERNSFKPFNYPWAYDAWLKHEQSHWLHTEVPMLEDVLKFLAVRLNPEAREAEISEKIDYAFNYIENFAGSLPNFSCAVEHVQLMTTLYNLHPVKNSESELSEK